MLGAVGVMEPRVNGSLTPPGVYTINVPLEPIDKGSCASISGGDTLKSGITPPLTVTQEFPKTVGAGFALLETVVCARFDPNMLIRPPPVKGCFGSEVFTTLVTTGFDVVASKFKGSTVKPDCVREMRVPLGSATTERVKADAPVRTVPLAAVEPPVAVGNTGASIVRVASEFAGLLKSTRSINPGVLNPAPEPGTPPPA